jgi:acetylornithine deacetylase
MQAEYLPASALEALTQMVCVNTVNSRISGSEYSEGALHDLIEGWARGWGFQVKRLLIKFNRENYNLLITHKVSDSAPWLLFESHSDTVGIEGMTIDPFVAEIREGKIFGRGVCDTKGSGAAAIWALKEYAEAGGYQNNIGILFVTDEEISKEGPNSFVAEHLPSLGWKPYGIVVGEPTACEAVVAHNGVIRWKVTTEGNAAHSSIPQQGKSAISAMAKLVLGFEKNYCDRLKLSHYLTGRAVCSVNTISGGTSVNIIPAHCEVKIDRRLLPGEKSEEVIADMTTALQEVASADGDITFREVERMIDPALDPEVNREFAAKIVGILASMGLASTERGAGYGSDASTYSHIGIPAIVLGPGSVDQAHQPDEWLDISEFEKAIEIYSRIMEMPL